MPCTLAKQILQHPPLNYRRHRVLSGARPRAREGTGRESRAAARRSAECTRRAGSTRACTRASSAAARRRQPGGCTRCRRDRSLPARTSTTIAPRRSWARADGRTAPSRCWRRSSADGPGQAVIDAGTKALGREPMRGVEGEGFGVLMDHPDVMVARMSEEHGILDLSGPTGIRGRRQVRIIPNHVCVVVHLNDVIYQFEMPLSRPVGLWRPEGGRRPRRPSRADCKALGVVP